MRARRWRCAFRRADRACRCTRSCAPSICLPCDLPVPASAAGDGLTVLPRRPFVGQGGGPSLPRHDPGVVEVTPGPALPRPDPGGVAVTAARALLGHPPHVHHAPPPCPPPSPPPVQYTLPPAL